MLSPALIYRYGSPAGRPAGKAQRPCSLRQAANLSLVPGSVGGIQAQDRRPFSHLAGHKVFERGHLHGLDRDLVGQVRGDHHDALAVAHHDIARPHGHVAAADGRVDVQRLVQRPGWSAPRAAGDRAAKPSSAISGESRKPPSVTTPATPRFIKRVTRMEPADAARASLRLSMTSTAPSGQVSTATRCGCERSSNTLIVFRSSRAGM